MQDEITDNAPPATTPDPTPPAEATAAPVSASAATTPSKPGAPDGLTTPGPSQAHCRPRRVLGKFIPEFANPPPDTKEQHPVEPPLPDDTVRVEYSVRVLGGTEVVADVRSRFDLPLALHSESLARTDCDFPLILDKIVVAPLITQVRVFLQGRFERDAEAKARKEAAAQPPPPPVQASFTIPKPANRPDIVLPEMKATTPPPKMPGNAN